MTVSEVLKVLEDCDFYELTSENFVDKVIEPLPMAVDYDSGVTKVAIFFPDTDFVVKIPFSGEEVADEEYDEEEHQYYETDHYYFSSFQFADDGETGDDYCKVEVVRYNHATHFKSGGVAALFAETSFVGYIQGYPIYIQPICEVFSKINNEKADEGSLASAKKLCQENSYYCFNPKWCADVVSCYGENLFEDLIQFLQQEQIDDLHGDNVGYLNGRPILFDYSGFND